VNAGSDINLCNGSSVQLSATGAVSYLWNTQTNLSDSTIANPIVNPTTQTQFWVTGEDANGCKKTDTLSVLISISPNSVMSNSSANDTLYLNLPNGNCNDTATSYIMVFLTNGINEDIYSQLEKEIVLYPNPANNYFTINSNVSINETIQFMIVDLLGNRLVTEMGSYNQFVNQKINIDFLSNGIYFVQLSIGNNMVTKKLSVTH
jgi:hypothetical protein